MLIKSFGVVAIFWPVACLSFDLIIVIDKFGSLFLSSPDLMGVEVSGASVAEEGLANEGTV